MSLIYTFPQKPPTSTSNSSSYSSSVIPKSLSSAAYGIYIGGKAEAKSRSFLLKHQICYILNVTPKISSDVKGRPYPFKFVFFSACAHSHAG
mmetsp:Transcript_1040/g.2035  ORF Transcript_1040/g.2035 Transcript_1040/m.2035 type:complete len:92 (+) Transcript_1040:90-365(+)